MHLPDGFLDVKTTALSVGAAVAGVSYALRQARSMEPRKVPMLGLAAAFLFAAQMLNFPVVGGTSGHMVGGVLVAILLGPAAAVIVVTCVLVVQALMFADGGLLALGANIFNMGVVSTCGGYLVFRIVWLLVPVDRVRATVLAATFAGWCGMVMGAISCAGQLALSNTVPWRVVFPAMTNVHMLIGIGEGVATGLIVSAVLRARPDLVLANTSALEPAGMAVAGYASLILTGLAIFVAPFVCPWPDGLESVASKLGFEQHAMVASMQGPLADYKVPFIGSSILATITAAAVGAVLAFIAAWLLARIAVPAINPARKNASAGN